MSAENQTERCPNCGSEDADEIGVYGEGLPEVRLQCRRCREIWARASVPGHQFELSEAFCIHCGLKLTLQNIHEPCLAGGGVRPARSPETVDHPDHYNHGRIEVIDVIEDWGLGFHLGNALKYILRAPHKGRTVDDLRKAMWYLERYCSMTARYRDDDTWIQAAQTISPDDAFDGAGLPSEGEAAVRALFGACDAGIAWAGRRGHLVGAYRLLAVAVDRMTDDARLEG